MNYTLGCLREMLAGGHRSVEVAQAPFEACNEHVDAGSAVTV